MLQTTLQDGFEDHYLDSGDIHHQLQGTLVSEASGTKAKVHLRHLKLKRVFKLQASTAPRPPPAPTPHPTPAPTLAFGGGGTMPAPTQDGRPPPRYVDTVDLSPKLHLARTR